MYIGMVYAMFSIGILGFLVWSHFSFSFFANLGEAKANFDSTTLAYIEENSLKYLEIRNMVALPYCEVGVINFAVCWNSLVLIGTFSCKNSLSYTQSAGNLYSARTSRTLKSPSETTRKTSFDFTLFQNISKTTITHDWLTWFLGFSEGDGAILTTRGRPRFVLTQKESEILYLVKEKLGFGTVYNFDKF